MKGAGQADPASLISRPPVVPAVSLEHAARRAIPPSSPGGALLLPVDNVLDTW